MKCENEGCESEASGIVLSVSGQASYCCAHYEQKVLEAMLRYRLRRSMRFRVMPSGARP